MARLEEWSLVMDERDLDPWLAPEMQQPKFRVRGRVYDHPGFEDGKGVTTSSLTHLDMENLNECSTQNTKYSLGTPDRDWVDYLKTVSSPYLTAALRKLDAPI